MVCYYLLRDNHETGPYTLTELKGKTLLSTDLIWIEGESTSWSAPREIPGLEGISLAEKQPPPAKPKLRSKKAPESYQEARRTKVPATGEMQFSETYLPPADYIPPSFESLKEKYAQKIPQKHTWKRQINIGANLMGMLTLFIGLGLSAYMIKKAVENIEYEPAVASAQSVEISPETLPSSTTAHTAFASLLPKAKGPVLVPDTTAASTTLRPVEAIEKKLPSVEDKSIVPLSKTGAPAERKDSSKEPPKTTIPGAATTDVAAITASNTNTGDETIANADKERKETEEKPVAKPSLRLSANNYNVGFLGGISNLEISVTNPSSEAVSKALVEVEFLRKNGKVVGSQTVTVSGLAPGGSKTVSIPDNSRGVSVRYKVIKTES